MFLQFQNQSKLNPILLLAIVQIFIFGIGALISYFTGFSYSIVLGVSGAVIMLLLLPFNSELQSYRDSAGIMMHHAHHQALKQMGEKQARWHDNFITILYGMIPFLAGILIATL